VLFRSPPSAYPPRAGTRPRCAGAAKGSWRQSSATMPWKRSRHESYTAHRIPPAKGSRPSIAHAASVSSAPIGPHSATAHRLLHQSPPRPDRRSRPPHDRDSGETPPAAETKKPGSCPTPDHPPMGRCANPRTHRPSSFASDAWCTEERVIRRRAVPCGTVGKRIAGTRKPRS